MLTEERLSSHGFQSSLLDKMYAIDLFILVKVLDVLAIMNSTLLTMLQAVEIH